MSNKSKNPSFLDKIFINMGQCPNDHISPLSSSVVCDNKNKMNTKR